MSEKLNGTNGHESNGNPVVEVKEKTVKVFTTEEEARAHKPEDKPDFVLMVTTIPPNPEPKKFFTWQAQNATAVAQAKCTTFHGIKTRPVDKVVAVDDVDAALASMSEESRKALIAKYYKKGKK